MRFGITSDARRLAAEISRAAGPLDDELAQVTARHGQLLRTRVRARASGRPGPRRRTGDYRRSITAQAGRLPNGTHFAIVGTNAPQGRRLEYGFIGVDALGRHYSSPPLPHFGPSLDDTAPEYEAAMTRVVDHLLGRRVRLR
jgi:hypothetical protein